MPAVEEASPPPHGLKINLNQSDHPPILGLGCSKMLEFFNFDKKNQKFCLSDLNDDDDDDKLKTC